MSDTDRSRESQAKEVFLDALELEGVERSAYLDRVCGGSDSLRARVDELLGAAETAEDWVSERTPAPARLELDDLEPGSRIDHYVLEEKIGEGGFGAVFLARQEEPVRRNVALKVVKLGMDTRAVIGRFELERQALAVMEHVNIAKVLDAGATEKGRPYFVMEYVDGVPITKYCEERALDLRARLGLFVDVCHAIQHAHQKGVIHRDIKPTNVLVGTADGRPMPKVIDFGIAKATDQRLDEGTLITEDGHMVGTPAYMSPEQADLSGFVDTRSDVYSLGALLYELCCGVPPFDLADRPFHEILETIGNTDPVRPSARVRTDETATTTMGRIERDIDWIVMRCLEKDPARRYPTAVDLASELERFLDGRAVEAAPPSAWYRLRKLARRHRAAVSAAAAVTLALAAGLAGTLTGLNRARREAVRAREAEQLASEQAREAELQASVARAVNDFLNQDLLGSAAPSAEVGRGREVLMRDVLDSAALRIEDASAPGGRFADTPLVEAAIRHTLGETYLFLGLFDAAITHLRRAVELRSAELGDAHEETLYSLQRLGSAYSRLEDKDGAAGVMSRLEAVLGPDIDDIRTPDDLNVLHLKGMVLMSEGKLGEAEEALERASELAHSMLGFEHWATLDIDDSLAVLYVHLGRFDDASELFTANHESLVRLFGDRHKTTMEAGINLANFLRGQGRTEDALALYDRYLDDIVSIFGERHSTTMTAVQGYARACMDAGRFAEAERLYSDALERGRESLGPEHTQVLEIVAGLGRLYELTGRLEEAEDQYRFAYEVSAENQGADNPFTLSRLAELCSVTYSQSGALRWKEPELADERLGEAEELMRTLMEKQEQVLGEFHSETLTTKANYAIVCLDLGREEQAVRIQSEVVDTMDVHLGETDSRTISARSDLSAMLLRAGQADEALELAELSVEQAREAFGPTSFKLATCIIRLGSALGTVGLTDAAIETLLEAEAILENYEGSFRRGEVAEYLAELYEENGDPEEAARWVEIRRTREDF